MPSDLRKSVNKNGVLVEIEKKPWFGPRESGCIVFYLFLCCSHPMPVTKIQIHQHCVNELNNRMKAATEALATLRESVTADTKSSMGDKYETGREMANQEMQKLQSNMHETKQSLLQLNTIDVAKTCLQASQGALVVTDKLVFYMAAPLGKVNVDGQAVMVISFQSPVGKVMLGKVAGETFALNGVEYRIDSVC
jgi:hypothetical protein